MPTSNSKNIKNLQYSKEQQAFEDMEKVLAKLGKARTRLALEQRLVFDAAAAATGAEVAADQVAQEQAELAVQHLSEGNSNTDLPEPFDNSYQDADPFKSNSEVSQNILSQALADSLEQSDGISLSLEPTEVLFIDGGVENVQDLLAAVPPNVEVFILDPSLDGVSQIATALEGRSGIDAIHIISHGDSAQLNLGSGIVTTNSIQGNHAEDLAEIGATLSAHGDILIYGCDFGAGEEGAQAVNLLAQVTGADIAASDDITGAEARGGDWDLEVEKGSVEADSIEAKDWDGALEALDISIPANAPVVEAVNADGQTTYTINNAGIVGGQSIDIRATVVSTTPGASISIYPSTGPINYGGDDILLVMNGAGDVEVRWDIFQSGTNQTVYAYGDPNFSIADLDGYGSGNPIETVSPSLNGITGYTLENNTTLEAQIAAGNVSVSGSANRNGQSDSMVTFHWRDVSSWNVIYTATLGGRHYLHDGNGDFTFVDSQTVYMLGIDLDANDSTAPNTSYAGRYIEADRATVIIDSDFEINQHPILGKTIHEATITLTNAQIGDHFLVNESANSTGTVRGLDYRIEEQNGIIRVIISGAATTQNYEEAIGNITFYTEGQNPDDTDRLINISVTNTTYGTTSNAALSTISVIPTNDRPIAVNDGLVSVLEDTPVSGNVLTNDSDVDGDTLNVTGFEIAGLAGSFTAGQIADIPNVGTLQINNDGSYTFTPALNYTGAIPTATYTLSDGNGETDTATLSFADIVNINDAPVAVDDNATTQEDTAVTLSVLLNDSDPDGDTLTITAITQADNGTVTIDPVSGNPIYTPNPNFNGSDHFSYTISDGNGDVATATAIISIIPVNDVMSHTAPTTADTTEDEAIVFSAANGNAIGVNHPDGGVLSITLGVNDGILTLSQTTGLTISAGANDSASMTMTGTPDAINAALDGLSFTPVPDYNGTATLSLHTVTAPIAGANLINGSFEDPDFNTTTYTIVHENNVPGWDTSASDHRMEIWQSGFGGVEAYEGDQFAELNANMVSTLSQQINPTLGAPLSFSFAHRGRAGVDTIEVRAIDLGADGVRGGGDDSVIFTEQFSDGNTAWGHYTRDLGIATGNPVILEFDSVSSAGNPAIGNFLDAVFIGETIFEDSNDVTINVTAVGDTVDDRVETAEDSPISFNVLTGTNGASADNFEGSPEVTTITQATNGSVTFAPDGTMTYTPDTNFHGSDSFTYTVTSPAGITETATVTVNITAVNDAPVAIDDTPLTVTAGGTVTVDVLPNDSDPDGDALSVTHVIDPANPNAPLPISQGSPVTLASGTVVSLLPNGSLEVTTAANMAETETLDYIISDGHGGTDNATITLNRDNDGDGVADIVDLDDDNDGILDVDEGLSYFTTTLDQVSALPASAFVSGGGVIPDGTQGLRLSNADGTYFLDLYQGSNSSAGAPFSFDTNSGRISSAGANVYGAGAGSGEVVEIVYTTLNSPNPFDLTTISILDIDSLTSGGGAGNVRDAYVWSEAGTWTPQGNPAAAVVSVDTAAADDVGSFVIEDPDGNNVIANIGQFTQVTAIDDTLSDVLLNPAGDGNNHNAQFVFEDAQTTASLFAFNSGGSNMYWAFNPQLDVEIFRPVGLDTDGDGIANHLDLDSDNDGISDLIESGQNAAIVDTNNDGIHDGAVDANGVPIAAGSNGVTPLDSDNDGIANMLDLDSDNDGIADAVEARPTAGYSSSTHANNATNNGVNDDGLYVPVDTDGDGTADYLDLDSDNDVGSPNGGTDAQESGLNVGADTNGDGIGDGSGASYADPDGLVNNPSADLYNQTGTTDEVGYREDNTPPETSGILDQSGFDAAVTTLDISGNFTDVDVTDVLTYSATGLPAGLSIDPATGIISGTIDPSASQVSGTGLFNVSVTADDGHGGQVSTSFDWVIVNPAPIANNDSDTTAEDTAFSSTVVGNDNDPDGDDLTYSLVQNVAHGTLVLNDDGTYTYHPDANFNGNDQFSYLVDDGEGGTASATVNITVTPVNDAPETSGISDQSSQDAQAITPLHISSSFTDIEADSLSFTASGLPTGLSIDPVTGIISGIVDPSASQQNGTGLFNVSVTADDDHGGQVSTSFAWAVANPAPIAVNDVETTNEDTGLNATVVSNDRDPDGDHLTFSLIDDAAHGRLSFNADGTYSYNPDPDFNGQDRFIYQVDDGEGGIATATVIITVTPVNDAPIAVNDSTTTDENSAVSGDITPLNIVGQDSDVDGDVLTIQEINGLSFTSGDPITLPSGAILTMAADGSYNYNPNGQFESLADGQTDSDYFTYRLSDGHGGIDTAIVTITITGVNDNPNAVDDTNATNEDTAVSGDLTPFNVVGQDSDVEPFDILSVSAINGDPAAIGSQITLPSGALLTVNADGSYDYSPQSGFDYLADGEQAQDRFTYTLSDGQGGVDTATVMIDITGVNDTPETAGIADQDSNDSDPITLDVSDRFSDIDQSDVLTFSATGLPTGLSIDPTTGIITGVINASASVDGPFDTIITADDGQGAQVSTSFTWAITNPAPVATDDAYTTDEDTAFTSTVADNDSDLDGDKLTYNVVTDVANGTLNFNADGSYNYQPNQDFNGQDSFSYLVDDGEGGTSTATVIITVTPINDAPVAIGFLNQTDQDGTLTTLDISPSFSDVDADTLTYSASGLPTGLSIDPITGVISGTIDPSASLNISFDVTITADDGAGGNASTHFSWEIINPAPLAGDDTHITDEDTAFTSTVSANDYDPDGDKLTYNVVTGVANGTLNFNPDGSYSYSPDQDFNGQDSFSYLVDDGEGGTSTATVIITVTPINDAPVTSGIADQSSNDSDITSFDITSSFSDVDPDTLTYSAVGLPTGLTLDPATGIIAGIIDPSASVNGPFNVVVTADDGQGAQISTSFTWAVANPAPVAGDDVETTDEDTAFNSTVATNDQDVDGDTLTYNVVSPVSHGTLNFNADGSYSYNPDQDFNGQDSFSYLVDDGEGGTSTATVIITVTSINDTPETTGITPQTSNDAEAITPLDISASFSDVDGDVLRYVATNLPTGLMIDPNTGIISGLIDPSASVDGPFAVTITADDGQGANISTSFTWEVANPAPIAGDDNETTDEDTSFNATVAVNDSDPDGDALTYSVVNSTTHGTLSFNPDGSYSYQPNQDFNGQDSFSYQVDDREGGVDTATVIITVAAINDAPVAVNDDYSLEEDAVISGDLTPLTGSQDSDVDGDILTITHINGLEHTSGQTITLPSGALLSVNADGSYSYNSNGSFNGLAEGERATDQFVYTLSDGQGGVDTATVSFTILGTNDAPIAVDDKNQTDQNNTAFGNLTPNTQGQDRDADVTDVLSVIQINGQDQTTTQEIVLPSGARLTVNADGSYFYVPNHAFDHLAEGERSQDSFTYTLSDGQGGLDTATVVIDIIGVNDAPLSDSIANQSGNDAEAITPLDISNNFSDLDNTDILTYSVAGLPTGLSLDPATGIISGTIDPSASVSAPFAVTITANDGQGGTVSTSFTWEVTNPAPIAGDDNETIDEDTALNSSVALNDRDPDGDALTYSVVSSTAHGTLSFNPDGSYSYSPDQDFNGEDRFSYSVDDGEGGVDTATVIITVTPINDAPVSVGFIDQSGEDAESINLDISSIFSDVDHDALTYDVTGLPTGLSLDPATGIISGTIDPSASVSAPFAVTITADDGQGGTVSTSFTWDITNPAPIAGDDNETIDEDTALNSSVALNDRDPDGDALTYSVVSSTAHGTLSFNPDGSYSYSPDQDFNGEDRFSYSVDDGEGGVDTATVIITVTPINDAPVAINDDYSLEEDAVISGDLTPLTGSQDSDVDGDVLTITDVNGQAYSDGQTITLPSGALLNINANGSYDYNPNGQFNGLSQGQTATDRFTYTLSDGHGGIDTAIVSFTILGTNDNPVIVVDQNLSDLTGDDAQEITPLNVATTFGDPDQKDILTYSATGLPEGLSLDSQTGVLSGTINPSASQGGNDGVYTITITATDPHGASINDQFDWTITNPAPVAINDEIDVLEGQNFSGNVITNSVTPDYDLDGDPIKISAVNGENSAVGSPIAGSHGGVFTVNEDGSYAFEAQQDFNHLSVGQTQTSTLEYTLSDGQGGTSTAIITATITGVNSPVTLVDPYNPDQEIRDPNNIIPVQNVRDGATPETLNIRPYFTDVDQNTVLHFSAQNLPKGLVLDAQSGEITGTLVPNASREGTYSVIVTATDEQGHHVSTILVYQVENPAPTTEPDRFTLLEDSSATGDVSLNDHDLDGDHLTFSVFVNPDHGLVTMQSDGTFVYTPNQDFHGHDSFSYHVTDSDGATRFEIVDLIITSVNDSPVVVTQLDDQDHREGNEINLNIAPNFSDLESDNITYSEVGLPDGLTLNYSTGLITGTLTANAAQDGILNVEITAHDGQGGAVSSSFIWSITPLPVIIDATPSTTAERSSPSFEQEKNERVSIGGASKEFAADGIIVSTLNGLKSLAGTLYYGSDQSSEGSNGQAGSQMVERVAHITGTSTDSWDAVGLTGFSLKMENTTQNALDKDSSGINGHLTVETLVHQKTIYIEIKDDLKFADDRNVQNYQVTMANGQPLPSWLRLSDTNMLIGERPAHSETIELHITANMNDGSKISKAVTIQTKNGEIRAVQPKG